VVDLEEPRSLRQTIGWPASGAMRHLAYQLVRIPLLGTSVNRGAATSLPTPPPSLCAGTFRNLWSYPELIALSFFAENATIHEVLYTVLQGFGQRCDHQRGDDHTQPGLLLLGYGKEEFLCHLVDDHEYAGEH
jgi:hypothetical protein